MRASRGLSFTSAIAVGLGAMVLLGACTPDETEPTPSASPTVEEPTPTPTPTTPPEAIAPERPSEMSQSDAAGAEAAAKYFLALYPYVYSTQDLVVWRAMSLPECAFCASVIDNVEGEIAAGNRSSGGLVTFEETLEASALSDDLYRVMLLVSQGPGEERGPDGTVVEQSEGGRYVMTVGLVPTGVGWTVSGVVIDDAPAA